MPPKTKSTTTLTADERKFLDDFRKRCNEEFNQLSDELKASCLNIKLNQQNKQATQHTINRLDKTDARLDEFMKELAENKKMSLTLGRRLEAVAFVNEWYAKWNTHATLTLAAVVGASEEYNKILNTKAQEPVGVAGIILGATFVFLPEIKILGRVFNKLALKRLTPKHTQAEIAFQGVKERLGKAKESIGKSANEMKEHNARITRWTMENNKWSNGKIKQAVDIADRQSKEIIDEAQEIKEAITAYENLEAASQKLINAHNAKNEVFKELLGNITSNLIQVTNLASEFYEYALSDTRGAWGIKLPVEPNRKEVIEGRMKEQGLEMDSVPIPVEMQYDTLSSLILYKMLKTYMKNYCTVETFGLERKEHWSSVRGLDGAQTKSIYARFGSKVWKSTDKEYPPLNNTDDLIKHGWVKLTVNPMPNVAYPEGPYGSRL